ncbi:hypothetical protein BDZ89DRAFT_1159018 [Hymenopellis radicata]|nr:hypothetical protein BDZ89DRAFT_1159018 [Hymenopellis radicata]
MRKALSRGFEEAYRIFRDEGVMRIIVTRWAQCGYTDQSVNHVIGGYIEGLDKLTSNSNRHEFCEYLHQPQQLILSFMLIVTWGDSDGLYDWSHSLRDLVKICPTHMSWRDCDTAMKAILVWAQTPNPQISLFPWPSSLQDLSATATFRKYPLVDWIAHRFSSQEVRENLEVGLETLHTILENTESVEGVLIPDLESQTRIDAASASPESQVIASGGD